MQLSVVKQPHFRYSDRSPIFENPAEALLAFAQSPFPLAVVDADLPGIDGYKLTGKMKAINPDSQIIVISKKFDKEATLLALRAGAADVFEQPIGLASFCKSINRAMQRFVGKAPGFHRSTALTFMPIWTGRSSIPKSWLKRNVKLQIR